MVKTKKGNVQEEWRTEHFGMIYASIIEGEVGGGFCCYFGKQHPNLQALFMGRSFNPNGAGPSITKKLCEKPIFFEIQEI